MQDKRKDTEEQEPRYTAIHKYAPISAQKVRVFADLIRGKYADEAMTLLECYPNRGARMLEKVLKSAMHNAEDLRAPALDDLRVAEVRKQLVRIIFRQIKNIFAHEFFHAVGIKCLQTVLKRIMRITFQLELERNFVAIVQLGFVFQLADKKGD